MTNFIRQTFLSFVTALLVCGQVTYGLAQNATPIPQPLTQFFDANGNPLSSGTVKTYIPLTSTLKDTWQDINDSVLNSNPLTLDAAGRAKIFGNGSYRFEVRDSLSNLIYDYVTNAPNPGGTVIVTGDGDLVGTIKPWAGLIAPNQYVFAFGQAISRTTFSSLLTAITQSITVNCTSGSSTLSGISDTSQIPNGAAIEASCVAPGTTVLSKTASTVVVSANASSTTSLTAVFFPYGNGDGSTTFNIPDLRGYIIAGRSNMGGVAASNLTSTFFGSNPQAIGAKGGAQSETLLSSNLPSISPTLNDPGHTHNIALGSDSASSGTIQRSSNNSNTGTTVSNTTGITLNHIGGSGAALSAVLITAGSGYTNGAQVLTISGGTCTVQPAFNVTVAGNVVISVNSVSVAGNCSVTPTMPASVTGGGGSGAKLDVLFTAQPITTIQPTFTLNYIIKVTPDTSATIASGVASIQGMIGAITCGSGLICTGNIIDVAGGGFATLGGNNVFNPISGTSITVNIVGGTPTTLGINVTSALSGASVNQVNAANTFLLNDSVTNASWVMVALQGHYVATSTANEGNGIGVQGWATTSGNTNTFYGLGIQGVCQASNTATAPTGLGGAGQCAGAHLNGQLLAGATGYVSVFAAEFNTTVVAALAGATAPKYKAGAAIAHNMLDAVRGATYDAAVSVSSNSLTAIGWKYGLLFSKSHGVTPFATDSIIIGALDGPQQVTSFLDFSTYTCSGGKEINFTNFLVDCSGNITAPLLAGGSGAASTLTLESTTGAGTTDAIILKTASQIERARITTGGFFNIGPNVAPDAQLTVNGNTAASVAPPTNSLVHVIGNDGSPTYLIIDSYGQQNLIEGRRAQGSQGAKTVLVADNIMFRFGGDGWNGSSYTTTAAFASMAAAETWSGTANGTYIAFNTTPKTTTAFAEAMRIQPSGGLSVGDITDRGIGTITASKAIQSLVLTVATLPTCNAAYEGSRAYVSDQNTAVAYRGAVTGAGTTRQAVLCSNSAWIQD